MCDVVNHIGEAGAWYVAEAIKKNIALSTFYLGREFSCYRVFAKGTDVDLQQMSWVIREPNTSSMHWRSTRR
jgi:hypothetical protein